MATRLEAETGRRRMVATQPPVLLGSAPGGSELPDGDLLELGPSPVGEDLDGFAVAVGEDLVGDGDAAVVGEHLDRGPVDQDAELHLAVTQRQGRELGAREL